jgi:hypothetical protein
VVACVNPVREQAQQELEARPTYSAIYRAEIPVRPAPRGIGKPQVMTVPDGFADPVLTQGAVEDHSMRGNRGQPPPG